MATLLLVEDSPTEAQIITSCLEGAGFTLLKVTTAEAAKAILSQKPSMALCLTWYFPVKAALVSAEKSKTTLRWKVSLSSCALASPKKWIKNGPANKGPMTM